MPCRLVLIIVLFLAGAARADPVEDLAAGADAYSRGDYAVAAQWFRKSADQGNATAQDSLGVMYVNGEGVPQDYVQAYAWFTLAAANVPEADQPWHARLDRFRNEITANMTAAQIADAQKLTREWTPPSRTAP